MNKVAVMAGGLALASAAGVMNLFAGESPIEIGDGSITFKADSTQQNGKEVKVNKFLHRVKTIDIKVCNTQNPLQSIDVKGRNWILSSVTRQVQVSTHTMFPLLQDAAIATCATTWGGSGSSYSCATADGSQLTPARLTFSDGNCPGGMTPTCTLRCPLGQKCVITLRYGTPFSSNNRFLSQKCN